ncbi:MAG: peptidase S41 [Candidatus Portnoybacteria bacterium CG08_land_8_20_14_0_20_40_83]|uniref:Peptidase S41 n=1 Tax=Candidatus Portnoybacteria bacterium CG_4_10_14_0_8_um_filter_40_50 TaxID=1974800 RepID=A0A2M7QR92_9BACT|nr:MAG: peptidase S41 [Candidatus Portnoybacteria bacterium CG08_land_8_20_14_0_20_40_83]PIY74822.1 MAG: peptidase S41 [Candidatus Portnoybacteria bacterium CG_4_10_14_0_8_um_filter_40_50]
MRRKFISSVIIVILLAGSFYGGFWYGKNSRPSIEKVSGVFNKETGKPDSIDFSLFWDSWTQIEEKFVNRSALDYQKMVYGAIDGMVKSLGDPYTAFFPPVESKKFSEDIKGSFDGIGAEIGMRKDILIVISPLEGSPAKKAGLLAGDQILKIDDKATADLNVDEAVNLIRGSKGTQVTLAILREGWSDTKDYKITRDVINVPILKYEIKDIGGKKIAYIQLYEFTENAANEFTKKVNEILNSNAQGIVLDLRGNPGGYLEVAVDIASWFVDGGKLVVSEDFGNGNKNEHTSYGYKKLATYPTVVLIDQGSASASEILAGALRDDNGIKLVGEKSFGKGSVQELENLRGGTSLKVTVAKWLTPSGHSIMEQGLEPDIQVGRTQEDVDAGRDPQLDKALEMLK